MPVVMATFAVRGEQQEQTGRTWEFGLRPSWAHRSQATALRIGPSTMSYLAYP